MTGDQIVNKLRGRAYLEPLVYRFKDGSITDLDEAVNVLLLLIDFHTEMAMGGITAFVWNSSGIYINETVNALVKIGCIQESEKLQEIAVVAESVESDDDSDNNISVYDRMKELADTLNRELVDEKMNKFAEKNEGALAKFILGDDSECKPSEVEFTELEIECIEALKRLTGNDR